KQTIQENDIYEKYNKFIGLLSELKTNGFLTTTYDEWFLQKRDQLEAYLVYLTIAMSKWLIETKQEEEAEQLLKQTLSILDDNEKIYDELIELYKESKKYDELEYWRNEKKKEWG